MNVLPNDEIQTLLADLPGWSGDEQALTVTWSAGDFRQAMAFMQACIEPIEALNHHPEWSNVYNRISISLRTHDAGDVVTSKDMELARVLSDLAQQHGLKS